jgi:hypothetical protein
MDSLVAGYRNSKNNNNNNNKEVKQFEAAPLVGSTISANSNSNSIGNSSSSSTDNYNVPGTDESETKSNVLIEEQEDSSLYEAACICGDNPIIWRTSSFCPKCSTVVKKAVKLMSDHHIDKGFGVFNKTTGDFLFHWDVGVRSLCCF